MTDGRSEMDKGLQIDNTSWILFIGETGLSFFFGVYSSYYVTCIYRKVYCSLIEEKILRKTYRLNFKSRDLHLMAAVENSWSKCLRWVCKLLFKLSIWSLIFFFNKTWISTLNISKYHTLIQNIAKQHVSVMRQSSQ